MIKRDSALGKAIERTLANPIHHQSSLTRESRSERSRGLLAIGSHIALNFDRPRQYFSNRVVTFSYGFLRLSSAAIDLPA